MVVVVFRKENERLASVCTKMFDNVDAAKKHIEEDADFFCSKHRGSIKCGWIKPNTFDYYMVTTKDFVNCIWQYFEI